MAGPPITAPLVTVCVPTYNGARFLRECLESALAQTWREFELLVVDDGSRDDSAAIAQDYARRDRRVRVQLNAQNLGPVQNWNRCVALARGSWIKPLFQDDHLERECLARMLEAGRPSEQLVVVRRKVEFERGTSAAIRRVYEPYVSRQTLRGIFGAVARVDAEQFATGMVERPRVNCIGELSAVMLHRSAFERFGRFNPELVTLAGWEFLARVAAHAGIRCVDEPLATIRVHPGSASQVQALTRRFRVQVLDGLIVEHEMANAAVYEPVRMAAARREPPVDLQLRLVESAQLALRLARHYAQDSLQPDRRAPAEWDEAVRRYPLLTAVPNGYRKARLAGMLRRGPAAIVTGAARVVGLLRPSVPARP